MLQKIILFIAFIANATTISSFIHNKRFEITFNRNYADGICNLMNLNNNLINNTYKSLKINKIPNYNNNRSLVYTYDNDNKNTKIILRTKNNYLIKHNNKLNDFLIFIKSNPISKNETKWNVYLKHDVNYMHEYFVHDTINKWLIKEVNRKSTELVPELFDFFHK